jgi:hypothetical protein
VVSTATRRMVVVEVTLTIETRIRSCSGLADAGDATHERCRETSTSNISTASVRQIDRRLCAVVASSTSTSGRFFGDSKHGLPETSRSRRRAAASTRHGGEWAALQKGTKEGRTKAPQAWLTKKSLLPDVGKRCRHEGSNGQT